MIVVHTPPLDCGRPRTTCNRGATACHRLHRKPCRCGRQRGESRMIIMSTSMRAALRLAAAAAMRPSPIHSLPLESATTTMLAVPSAEHTCKAAYAARSAVSVFTPVLYEPGSPSGAEPISCTLPQPERAAIASVSAAQAARAIAGDVKPALADGRAKSRPSP